jgi:prepilin-type N-terminal cleavage/methylation domain-containing protein
MSEAPRQRPTDHGRALSRAGFSLLELVVVLGVITVAVSMAVPRFARAGARYRCLNAGSRVLADVGRARELALASSAGVEVRFKGGASRYAIEALQPGGAGSFTTDLARPPYTAWVESANFGGSETLAISGLGAMTAGTMVVRTEQMASVVTVKSDGAGSVAEPAGVSRKPRVDDTMTGGAK